VPEHAQSQEGTSVRVTPPRDPGDDPSLMAIGLAVPRTLLSAVRRTKGEGFSDRDLAETSTDNLGANSEGAWRWIRKASSYFEQYQKERLCSHELRNWRLATPGARVCNALPAAIRCRYSDLLIRIAAFDIYNLRRASRSTYMCFHKSKRLVVDPPSVGLRDARDPVASIRNG
jgi:hypothetical protein